MNKKKIFYGWWIVLGGAFITATVLVITVTLSSYYLLSITEEFGIGRAAFSLNTTISSLVGIVVSPIAGKLFKKYDMHKLHIFAVIGLAVAYASYSLAQSVVHMYISSFFLGLFVQPTVQPVTITITKWFTAKRGTAISITFMGVSIGAMILSKVVAYLIANMGWRVSYVSMAGLMFVVDILVVLFIFKNKPEDMGLKPYGEGDYKPKVKTNKKEVPKPLVPEFSFELSFARKKSFFFLYMGGIILLELVGGGAMQQLNPALTDFHGAAFAATFVSLNSLLGIGGKLILGWLSDKLGPMRACTIGYICYAISFALLIFAQNQIMIYVMLMFYFIGGSVGTVISPIMTGATFGPKNYSEFNGVAQMGKIGTAFGGVIIGGMFDILNSYTIAWGCCAVLLIAALTLIRAAFKGSRRESQKLLAEQTAAL